MKLDRFASGATYAVGFGLCVALAAGCSSSATNAAPRTTAAAAASQSQVPNAVATTNLMSAEIPGPAPRVGKAHLAVDDGDMSVGDTGNVASEENTPKEARRSDGSRRGGGFGTSK